MAGLPEQVLHAKAQSIGRTADDLQTTGNLRRPQDVDVAKRVQAEQIAVASHDRICPAGNGDGKKLVIPRVAASNDRIQYLHVQIDAVLPHVLCELCLAQGSNQLGNHRR